MDILLEDIPGKKVLLLGNEAAVRGAIEGGCAVAATYPGTPSSEIGNTLFKVAKKANIYFEFSVNEKVAMEVAGAAAVAGVRAMAFMKHVGLNVASDAFMTLGYTGVRAGLVIISADDPSAHSSQNEQDNRYYGGKLANIPMLEPSNPMEFKEMVREGFDISERLELPVLVRTTTRVNHVRGIVEYKPIKKDSKKKIENYEKDPFRFVVVPQVAVKNHPRLLRQMEKAATISEETKYNFIEFYGNGKTHGKSVLIVTSGVSYGYVKDALKILGIGAKVFKLGMTNPLPEKSLAKAMAEADIVIPIEELEPYLETELKRIAYVYRYTCEIKGKDEGIFPRIYEYNPDIVMEGIAKALNMEYRTESGGKIEHELPSRPPAMCPGCPHRATYFAVKKVFGDNGIYPMDIGCYTLGIQPPYKVADLLLCMGSSIGTACGFSKVYDGNVVAFIGDSTFFHAGLPGVVNALHNKHRFVLAILDNSTTAMTGHQPHPGLPVDGMGDEAPAIDIAELVKGMGVEFVRVVDPYNLEETIAAFKEAKEYQGLSVIVARQRCALIIDRDKRRSGIPIIPYTIDQEKCRKCLICINAFGCPALQLIDKEGAKRVEINDTLCDGCGVCAQVCPFNAIIQVKEGGETHE